MHQLPHITVATIVERAGKFLMVKENSGGRLVYNQPAGHVEVKESLLDAAIRETLEETSWRVNLEKLLGIYQYTSPENGITFIAEPLQFQQDAEIDSDIDSAEWMTLEQIKDPVNKPRSELVHQAVDDFISGRVFPLEIFHNGL